jgi:ACS family glucarate transporter-like MFS transporter
MIRKFPYRYRVLVFLFTLTLITYLDRICISLVGVRIKSEFDLTNEQFGWVLASFSLAYAIFEIPSGVLGDRIGQRSVLLRIVIWWSLLTILTGATTGLLSLIIVRFFFGMGEAGAFPNSSAVISHWFPAKETARGVSSLFLGLNAGSAIAPIIIIPIAVSYGWRASFFVIGLVGLLWAVVCYTWFRNNPSEMKGISEEEKNYIEKNRRFKKHDRNFPWKTVLRNRSLLALSSSYFCSQWGRYFFIAWMPVYLQEGKHFHENEMKITTFFVFLTGVFTALSAGFLSDWLVKKRGLRFGRRFIGTIAQGVLSLCLFIAAISADNYLIVISLIVGHLFFSANGIASFSSCVDIAGDNAGTVAGIMNFFGQAGAFLLAILFGKLVDVANNFNTPVFVLSGVLLAGALLWFLVDPVKPLVLERKYASGIHELA